MDSVRPDKKIEIEIVKTDNELIFSHDGRPFRREEIAHLIYHGSTKSEQDIGKFGTGFLITHLLSREVDVKGIRNDGKTFEFTLNRNGSSYQDIKAIMEKTWNEYQSSLKLSQSNSECTARYEYPLTVATLKTVDVGLGELVKIAPYVLAFNDKIGIIKITKQNSMIKFELIKEEQENCGTHKVVKEEREDKVSLFHEIWLAKNEEVEVAIKGEEQDGGKCNIDSLEGIPKIFLAFPLFATQDLPFPVVINSRKFAPAERRDGIYLGKKDTDAIRLNKRLLESASKLFVELISKTDSDRWSNINTLLGLQSPPEKEWLDRDWYTVLLRNLVIEIGPLRVLRTESGNLISLKEGYIPLTDNTEANVEELWDIYHRLASYKEKLPAKALANDWAAIITGWKSVGSDISAMKVTSEELAREIEQCEDLKSFKAKLDQGQDEFSVINDFYSFLLDNKKQWIFDNNSILPDQNEILRKKKELYKDEGIDSDLKDICTNLGDDIRNHLLHPKVCSGVQNLLSRKSQQEVLDQVLVKVKQISVSNSDVGVQANVDLFDWLLRNDEFEYFEGYPVLTGKEKVFSLLSEEKEKLLAPKEIWNEKARVYFDLFPPDLVISSQYYEKNPQNDKWAELQDRKLILKDPLYYEKEKIRREDLEYFVASSEKIDEDKTHEITEDVQLSKIASLETKDKGIIDTIRGSKEKARKFLNFVIDYVVEADKAHWDSIVEVNCECGSKHKIYPAQWVSVLKRRQWVPAPKDKPLTSANLSIVLKDQEELLKKCRQDQSSKLLILLNMSISELMMHVAAKNDTIRLELDKAMGSLFSTFMTRPDQLNKIARLAESDTELFVKEIEERIQIKEQINRNQLLGSLVEDLLRSVLEAQGFKVERTGVGSDFEVENDFVKDDKENIFDIKKENSTCILLEIKSTYRDYARMTLTQAKEARDKPEKYALCVVSFAGEEINEDIVRTNARFVTDIGRRIKDKVIRAENHQQEQEVMGEIGDIEIELNEGPIKFKITKKVWEQGKTFEQFLEFMQTL